MKKNILITGGAGFIGINSVIYFLRLNYEVTVFDNLSRKGSALNLEDIKVNNNININFVKGDIRNIDELYTLFKKCKFSIILHLAAQVAVTTSIKDPLTDFDINAKGTLNLLEAIRKYNKNAILIYSSTNKIYGSLNYLQLVGSDKQYNCIDYPKGIDEKFEIDFHSPYGCSKGAADQYVRDYCRIYNLKTIVFRQSCIYGYRQLGIEDQGWVAWFIIAALYEKEITIFGDGRQVRDILFVDDLIEAFHNAILYIDKTNGEVYNIGGGIFKLSPLALIDILKTLTGMKINISFNDWRKGDQKFFASNNGKALKHFLWKPKTDPNEGINKIYNWIVNNEIILKKSGII